MRFRSILSSAAVTALVVSVLTVSPGNSSPVSTLTSANYQDTQWSLKSVRATQAWGAGYTGDGVKVAVIDTGVDYNHPDLAGQVVDGATITYDSSVSTNAGIVLTDTAAADFTDEEGHGTHVSGIIAAKHNSFGVTGLAYNAEIMPIKLTNLGEMDLPAFAQALDDALAFASTHGAKVANLSLGGPALEESNWITLTSDDLAYKAYTNQICQAVTDATNSGVLVVAAAGNYYQQGNPALVPSSCSDAYSVASASPNTTSTSYFSTTDPGVDITAPGESILSTVPSGLVSNYFADFPYAEMSGTSMATPMVVAAAALYIEYAGSPTPAQIRNAINDSATNMTAIAGWDPYSGYGMVDAAALVGADSPRGELAAQPYMRVMGGRPSNNYAASFTILWDAPAINVLPNSYDVVISEKTSEVVHTYDFPSGSVRGVIPFLGIDDFAYLQVIAHYDGYDLKSPPFLYSVPSTPSTPLPTPTGLKYTLGDDGHLVVKWDAVPSEGVDHLIITVDGISVGWTAQDLYPVDGTLPNSFDTYLGGTDPLNSDFTISLFATDANWNWGEAAVLNVWAKAPMALIGYELAGNKAIRIYAVPNRAGCDTVHGNYVDCLGRKFSYSYRLSGAAAPTVVKGARGVAGNTSVSGNLFDSNMVLFDNIQTGLGNFGMPRDLTLTAAPYSGGNGGIKPVHIYLNLPVGSTPNSIRKDAGLPPLPTKK